MQRATRGCATLLALVLWAVGCAPTTACRAREAHGPVAGSYRVHRFASDGRVLAIIATGHGESGRDAFTYDGAGRLVRRETTWSQDAYRAPHPSRLDRDAMSSTTVVDYTYGSDGKKARARRGADVETYRWHDDQLVEVERTGAERYAWRLRWDGPRLLEARHVSNGRATMTFAYTYDASGRRTREVLTADFLAQPRTFVYAYDPAGHLVARDLVIDGAPVVGQSDRLTWDARGRLVRLARHDIVTSFTYDAEGRVVRVEHTGDSPRTFEYEASCTSGMSERLLGDPLATIWSPVETL